MTIGNGFMTWYLLLIIIMLITTILPWKKSKKTGKPLDYYDLGLAGIDRASKFDWVLLGKSAVLATLMIGLVYILVWICQSLFLLDFRIIWPFFRPYSWERLLQCLVYAPFLPCFLSSTTAKYLHRCGRKQQVYPVLRALCHAGGKTHFVWREVFLSSA